VLYGGVRLKTILNVLLVVASVKGYPKEAGHGKRKASYVTRKGNTYLIPKSLQKTIPSWIVLERYVK